MQDGITTQADIIRVTENTSQSILKGESRDNETILDEKFANNEYGSLMKSAYKPYMSMVTLMMPKIAMDIKEKISGADSRSDLGGKLFDGNDFKSSIMKTITSLL